MAADQPVAVVVVPAAEARAAGARGAAGLLVPGAGPTVTRDKARAALVRGRVRNAVLGGTVGRKPLITLARRPGATTNVSLPPEGETHKSAVPGSDRGPGYRGCSTRPRHACPGSWDRGPRADGGRARARRRSDRQRGARRGRCRRTGPRRSARCGAQRPDGRQRRGRRVVLVAALFGLARRSGLAARAAVARGPAAVTAALLLSGLGPTPAAHSCSGSRWRCRPSRSLVRPRNWSPSSRRSSRSRARARRLAGDRVARRRRPAPRRRFASTGSPTTSELLLAPVILAVDRSRASVPSRWARSRSSRSARAGRCRRRQGRRARRGVRGDRAPAQRRRVVVAARRRRVRRRVRPRAPRGPGGRGRRWEQPRDARGRGWAGNAARRRARSAPPLGRLGVHLVGVRIPRRGRRRRARRARACGPPPATLDAMFVALVVSLLVNDSPVDVALYGLLGALSIVAYERTHD